MAKRGRPPKKKTDASQMRMTDSDGTEIGPFRIAEVDAAYAELRKRARAESNAKARREEAKEELVTVILDNQQAIEEALGPGAAYVTCYDNEYRAIKVDHGKLKLLDRKADVEAPNDDE